MRHVTTRVGSSPFVSLLLITLVSLAVAACGGAADEAGQPDETGQQEEYETTDAAAADTSSFEIIEITMSDFAFEPSAVTVPVGKRVRLDFRNTGSVVHEFMVGETFRAEGEGFETGPFEGVDVVRMMGGEVVMETNAEGGHAHLGTHIELEPDETGSLIFRLPETKSGTYKIGCFEITQGLQHFEQGMQGSLEVVASDTTSNSM